MAKKKSNIPTYEKSKKQRKKAVKSNKKSLKREKEEGNLPEEIRRREVKSLYKDLNNGRISMKTFLAKTKKLGEW